MPDGFTVDTRSLEELTIKLERAAIEAQLEVDRTLLTVGEEMAGVSREIAGEHSKSIPPSIKARPLRPGAVEIIAGGPGVPLAELYEIGNKGGKRTSKTFRHPVFGHEDRFVEQPRYRFFAPARTRLRARALQQLVQAWDRALERSGLNNG